MSEKDLKSELQQACHFSYVGCHGDGHSGEYGEDFLSHPHIIILAKVVLDRIDDVSSFAGGSGPDFEGLTR